ncbi:MAG: metallophosphoesterase [Candidatus Solibacter usitatus]|nr:metallophosphoesterase [Candidatus Solibacter usitatus]
MKQWLGIAALALATLAVLAFAAPDREFHFAIMGDRTGRADDRVYQQIWREIEATKPAFVINAGDSIEGGDDDGAAAEWASLRRIWQRVPYPLYCTPGNHDIWSARSQEHFHKATGHPPAYSFNYQNAHFTVLDNSRTDDLAAEQLRFLEEDLKANAARRPKFIFFHKPYWILFLKVGSGEFPLHQLARKYGVEYVICGHAHQFIPLTRDGIIYAAVGSSGASIERGTRMGQGYAQGWFYGHVQAAVNGDAVELTVKEAAAPFGKGRSVRIQDWDKAAKAAAE